MPFVCSSFSEASGSCTSSGFIIADVVIMKMIRSTRKTSVSGVMLISATMWPRVCDLNSAIGLPRGGDRLDQPPAPDAQRRVDLLHAVLEVVVEDERHDADGDAERGRDKRLGDAAGDDAEAARAREAHGMERPHDADDRAEEPDERRRGADRAEDPEIRTAALYLLELALVGDVLEDRQRRPLRRVQDVAVDAPRRALAV